MQLLYVLVLICISICLSWSYQIKRLINGKLDYRLYNLKDNLLNTNEKDVINNLLIKINGIDKQTILKISLISGPLGMLLDNYHGLFGVLSYDQQGIPINIYDFNGNVVLRSAVWVPLLFAFAGFAMSSIGLLLDEIFQTNNIIKNPTGPKTLYSVSLFSFQYYLSGLLDHISTPVLTTNIYLFILAIIGFMIFDGSLAGFILAILTTISGPLAEIFLINAFHLYKYNNADIWGICSWIPWIYFLGAPAVLNLTRLLNRK